jgi:NitT/TauT family transport system permease protein
MSSVVANIPKEEFDHARSLRMSNWRAVYEVIILGKADEAIEVLRQNAAIGWMMLTMVEGLVRSEGGIGTLMLNEGKHFHLDAVFAIQLTILFVGWVQDKFLGFIKNLLCPYANLTLERK